MRVLVACEYSGRVRDAFIAQGHAATSCDLLPTESPGPHYQGDVRDMLDGHWDMLIGFPPCTYLCSSGNRWHAGSPRRDAALDLVRTLMDAPVHRIAIENPVGVISGRIRKPDQVIQPYHYGDPWRKATCLWLKNLPRLIATDMVEPLYETHLMRNGKDPLMGKKLSLTYQGIANAMAMQWGTDGAEY